MANGRPLPDTQRQLLADAGLLVLNKSEDLTEADRVRVASQLPGLALYWTHQAALPIDRLPGLANRGTGAVDNLNLPNSLGQMPAIWSDPTLPICLHQQQGEGWSIGWRWHPGQRFDVARLSRWLHGKDWKRAKMVIHSEGGWVSANALDAGPLEWQASEWRQDSRIELIFAEQQDVGILQAGLADCRHP